MTSRRILTEADFATLDEHRDNYVDEDGDTYVWTAPQRAFGNDEKATAFLVESDGTVRVWDSIAQIYTHAHGLSERQQAAIRAAAR